MKKILTLFVMLLCGWSIVSAQAPVFGYQAVVRTADNELVANTAVDLTVDVMSAGTVLYSESKTGLSTDNLGMLNILVGNGTTSSTITLADIDWSEADTLRATVTVDGNDIVVETPIYAVPYALQANTINLTTEQIVAYLSDPETTIEDYKEIMDSLVTNVESNGMVWQKIKKRFVRYFKEHKNKAVEIASYYFAHADADDVNAFYAQVASKQEVVDTIVALTKAHALENKDFAVEVLEAYLSLLTKEEVDTIVATIKLHQEELFPYVRDYAKSQRTFVLTMAKTFFEDATAAEVKGTLALFSGSQMKQKFVNDLFYNYLDSYIQTSGTGLTTDEIVNRVGEKMEEDGYVKKIKCGTDTEPVNICDIWEDVEQIVNP